MSSAVNNPPENPGTGPNSGGSQLSIPQPPQPSPSAQPQADIPHSPAPGQPGQSLFPAATPPLAGRTLGQYRILEKIGQGGMGSVFKAFDAMLERTVALKVLFSSVLDDSKHSERFLREARSLARLNHPNLVHVYNVGFENECYFFAMELVEGETLSSGIRRRRRIPVHELLPYIGQVLSALHYIHQQGITHRDIKSSNIMLSGKRAVLMDFGLAKDENFTGLTSVGAIVGTPDYMSPEAAEGTTAGAPTDIYSLGVVMYEALSGAVPFIGRSAMSIIRQHIDMPPPPIEAALPAIDPMMASIVHKCLSKKPQDRYPDCASLAADLSRLLNTPELAALAQEQLNQTGRTAPRGAMATAGGSDGVGSDFEAMGADGTLLDTRAGVQRAMADADITMTAGGAGEKSPHLTANVTVVDPERTQVLPETAANSSRPSLAWVWMAAGFFGVFFLAYLVGRMRNPPVTTGAKDGASPLVVATSTVQTAVLRHPDGAREEIRMIEFKADDPNPSNWSYTVERRQSDGTWKRATISHRDFVHPGDTLEMLPGTTGTGPKP